MRSQTVERPHPSARQKKLNASSFGLLQSQLSQKATLNHANEFDNIPRGKFHVGRIRFG